MSQFLIFTFVIAMSLFMIIVDKTPAAFPDNIPAGILALLGISGGSYVISNGIQAGRDRGLKEVEASRGSSPNKQP